MNSPARWLIPLWLAYLCLCAFLWKVPNLSPALFGLTAPFILIFYILHERARAGQGTGWSFAAWILSTALPFIKTGAFTKMELAVLAAGSAAVFAAWRIGHEFLAGMELNIAACKDLIRIIEGQLKAVLKEKEFYIKKIPTLKSQIVSKQRLSAYARQMNTLLVPEKIKQTLIDELKFLFPGDEVALHTPAQTDDPLDFWVVDKDSSILVADAETDKRFEDPETGLRKNFAKGSPKSIAACPLHIERTLMGLVRVQSPNAHRFEKADLEQLELYAHLSTLALENAQLFDRVNAMATRDGLTGLATHRIFQEKLAEEILRAARYHKEVSLVMVDIDHFKKVNDGYGHLAGDEVLRTVAKILADQCREYDFAARYGGEEFCLIFPETNLEQAARLAEQLRLKISQAKITHEGLNFRITASLGCAAFPTNAPTAVQLVRQADERLYRAKHAGRNRVVAQ